MFINRQQLDKLTQTVLLQFKPLLKNQHFFLLGIFTTLAVLHLNIIINHRIESENIAFYAIYWGGILYLLFKNPPTITNPNQVSSYLGCGLLFLVILRPINFWHLDLMLFRFGPVIAGLGLGLLSFGFSGLKHYWRLFLLLLLMLCPYGFINEIFNSRLHFSEVTAATSAFLLHYIGLGATHTGALVKLPTGQVEVLYYCTGGLLIVWLLQLTLLMIVVVFPLNWKQQWGLFVSAFATGFLVGCIRVALLAVVVNNKSVFDYWHSYTGGSIFMAIATVTFATLSNWILPVDILSNQVQTESKNLEIEPKRVIFLTTTWLGIILTFFYLTVSKKTIGTNIFSEQIAVENWQQIKAQSLGKQKYDIPDDNKHFLSDAGHNYTYYQKNQEMQIQMRYVVNTRGEINPFLLQINQELKEKANQIIEYLPEVGYYSLYNDGKQAYLTSCINPRGGSTVNSSQFMKNRYNYDININRIIPWILGKDFLRDDRCIWTQISLPLNDKVATEIYPMLKLVWQDNYITWQYFLRKGY
ncbi:cyanoexosortase A system-associated protein [Okeanomitos corallinicola TIOX110]|uniref:Cyanoexosortase A system-associated protein n=1 Tax=Okeanomitos corallinicola TIOX110 TaxID=3133117 RepID=A0ABZ2V1D8_9CYAN